MSDTAENTESTKNITFTLPATVTIETVEALASSIHDLALASDAVLSLDASQTEILTTPGIQLLLSVEKTLSSGGGKLELKNVRSEVADNFRVLGLSEQFNQWSNANG